jgi:hypothetical protein
MPSFEASSNERRQEGNLIVLKQRFGGAIYLLHSVFRSLFWMEED